MMDSENLDQIEINKIGIGGSTIPDHFWTGGMYWRCDLSARFSASRESSVRLESRDNYG